MAVLVALPPQVVPLSAVQWNLDKLTSTHGFSVALSKYPEIDGVDIYEAATHYSEVGAGIGIWPRVWQILAKMGLDEDLASDCIEAKS